MRVFITGGAGYVGSACLRYLLERGHEVLAIDNLSEGHAQAVPGGVKEGRLHIGDISDTRALTEIMGKFQPDAVMHFAAACYVGESVVNPEFHYRNNVGGTLSLLNAMRAVGVKRMLFSSTAATYGVSPVMPIPETAPQNPVNPYGRSKLAVEWMIRDFSKAYGIGFTLLRYFNASGADKGGNYGEDHRTENHLIPLVLKAALGHIPEVQVFGDDWPTPDRSCIRDYVHTDDLAAAHLLAIEHTTPETGEMYNIGTGAGNSVFEVIRACEEVSGRKVPMKVVGRRPGDPPVLVADSSKLQRQLNWKPGFTDIREIVATALAWHAGHPRGYES